MISEDRLLRNSYLDTKTECWVWVSKVSKKGYGHVTIRLPGIGPRNRMAHRESYKTFRSTEIPDEMTLDHLCKNRRCINPAHLEIVTRAENTRRAHAA